MADVQAPAPSAAPSAPAPVKKKSNSTTVIIIIVVALVVLGAGGYFVSRWLARRAADKIAGGILGAATGSNVSVNSDTGTTSVSNGSGSTTVGNAKWPSDMPSDVPELKSGKITLASSDKTNKSWSVAASDVTQAEYTAYKALVVAAGWTSTSSTTSGATLDQYGKGTYDLSMLYDTSSSGITITVTPKAQ